MIRPKLSALAALGFACGACASDVVCPSIACANGLKVKLATTPTGPYRIEATWLELATPRVYDCADASACAPVTSFLGYEPETATITVTYAGRTSTTNVTPTYSQPAANSCGCESATVTLPLP